MNTQARQNWRALRLLRTAFGKYLPKLHKALRPTRVGQ